MDGVSRALERSEALVTAHQQTEAAWAQQQQARMEQLTTLWRTELAASRQEEVARGEAAAARISELTTQLRTEMGRLDTRDTLALQERQQLMERLHGLLESAEATTQGQRAAIDALVTSAGPAG
jgi:chromosome segregation ATPase